MAAAIGTAIVTTAGPYVIQAVVGVGTSLLAGAVNNVFHGWANSAIQTGCEGAGEKLGQNFAGSIASPDTTVGSWLGSFAQKTGGFFGKQVVGKMVAGQYAGPLAEAATGLAMNGLVKGASWMISGRQQQAPVHQPFTTSEDFQAFQEWQAFRREQQVRQAAENLAAPAA